MRTYLAVGLVMAVASAVAAAEPTKEDKLKAVKEACVVLELQAGAKPGQGVRWSGVAVGRGGYFVTAIATDFPLVTGAKVWVTLRAGEKGEKLIDAEVVRADATAGLALIRAKDAGGLPAATLGDDEKVGELDELTAFGAAFVEFSGVTFNPDGTRQTPAKAVAELKVSVAGRVLGADKKPTQFTLDKPGVKGKLVVGGPAANDKGELVGLVAREGPNAHPATAIGAVVTLRAVNAFLAANPVIDFDPPEVDPKAKFDPAGLKAGLFAGFGKPDGFTVELIARSGGRERKVEMKAADDGYGASVAPFEKTDQPDLLTAEVAFPDSRPRLPVAGATFKVGGKEFALSDVTRVRFGKGGGVTTLAGPVDGEVTGLDELAVRTGGQAFALKTATAAELAVRLPAEPKNCYRLAVVAKKDGKEVDRAEVVRFIKGTAPSGLNGLRMGYFVKPKATAKPVTYARLLVAGEDDPQAFTADRMPVAGGLIPSADGLGKFGLGGVTVDLYRAGWKPPQSGDPFNPEAVNPLFKLQFTPAAQKFLTAGEGRTLGLPQPAASPSLWVMGTGMPALKGVVWGGQPLAQATAVFVIHEVEADKDGKVTKFAADFVFRPTGMPDQPVVGVVRLNSSFE